MIASKSTCESLDETSAKRTDKTDETNPALLAKGVDGIANPDHRHRMPSGERGEQLPFPPTPRRAESGQIGVRAIC